MTQKEKLQSELISTFTDEIGISWLFSERQKELLKDISQLQEEEMYPREFVEWVGVQELFFDLDNLWIFETDEYGVVWKKTTDELFEYWQSKVKNEKI